MYQKIKFHTRTISPESFSFFGLFWIKANRERKPSGIGAAESAYSAIGRPDNTIAALYVLYLSFKLHLRYEEYVWVDIAISPNNALRRFSYTARMAGFQKLPESR